VEWDGFKVLSGCIRPGGRLLFTPVEWWSHSVSKLTFRLKYIIPASTFRNEKIHDEAVTAGSPRQEYNGALPE